MSDDLLWMAYGPEGESRGRTLQGVIRIYTREHGGMGPLAVVREDAYTAHARGSRPVQIVSEDPCIVSGSAEPVVRRKRKRS